MIQTDIGGFIIICLLFWIGKSLSNISKEYELFIKFIAEAKLSSEGK